LEVKKKFDTFFLSLSGVNFTNILCKDFMRVDPKSVKNTVKLSAFFALLGSLRIKFWWNWPWEAIKWNKYCFKGPFDQRMSLFSHFSDWNILLFKITVLWDLYCGCKSKMNNLRKYLLKLNTTVKKTFWFQKLFELLEPLQIVVIILRS